MIFLQWFLLPIITSILGGIFVYLLFEVFWVGGGFILSGYPNISGRWQSTYPDQPNYPGEQFIIKQLGPRISGELNQFTHNIIYKLRGHVSPTRFIQIEYGPKKTPHDKYGTALLKLNSDLTVAEGYLLFLPDDQPDPTPIKVRIEKLNS